MSAVEDLVMPKISSARQPSLNADMTSGDAVEMHDCEIWRFRTFSTISRRNSSLRSGFIWSVRPVMFMKYPCE